MSDFDKEAEREKLREKFERDEQKRAQSERMSELLLKGATMTNKHHDCGSPVFRWNGEEFCPSCEGPAGADAAGTDVGESESDPGRSETAERADANPEGTVGVDEPTDATDGTAGPADAADAAAGTDEVPGATEIDVAAEPSADAGAGTDADPTPTRSTRSGGADRTGRVTDEGTTAGTGEDGAVAAAQAAAERTLADVAREAEETSTADLSRKRSLVVATREAAEALEAIRRADGQ
jgi:uncharacterized Zn finger protein (UPF0148 family)